MHAGKCPPHPKRIENDHLCSEDEGGFLLRKSDEKQCKRGKKYEKYTYYFMLIISALHAGKGFALFEYEIPCSMHCITWIAPPCVTRITLRSQLAFGHSNTSNLHIVYQEIYQTSPISEVCAAPSEASLHARSALLVPQGTLNSKKA